ncbi:MAG: hypothetical protein ACR2NL_03060, partial [Acidimicrobiia bacterium]
GLRPLYLPTDFEGNPMRKDFPLLARMIKPWPGIVDVEPMPDATQGTGPSVASEPAPVEAATPEPEPVPIVASEPAEPAAPAPAPTPEPVPIVASEPVGEETDAADIAGIPEHLLKRSREAKGDAT